MYKLLFCLNLFLLVACGKVGMPSEPTTPEPTFEAVREFYLEETWTVQDGHGFVDVHKCDSVLHSALLSAGGAQVDLKAARNSDGQWFRRPLSYTECLSAGESKSTFSRDMLLGLMWAWAVSGNWEDAEAFYQYAVKRDLKFGETDGSLEGASRVYMSSNMMSLLAELIYRLGGPDHAGWRAAATRHGSDATGFEAHLHVLSTLLWGRLTGYYTGQELNSLHRYSFEHPDNALFQYAWGLTDRAEKLLMMHHPHDRLPTEADFCNPLRYETEENHPCPSDNVRVHAPTHFLFISKLILDRKAKQ